MDKKYKVKEGATVMIGQTPYKAGQIITDRGNNAKITMAIDKLSSSKNPVIESIRTADAGASRRSEGTAADSTSVGEAPSPIASSRATQAKGGK